MCDSSRSLTIRPAIFCSREVAENACKGPIAAIDIGDDILDSIRDTRLSDPDSWRATIQNAPLNERKYLTQVHELLRDMASTGHARSGADGYTNAFIYNLRTGSCVYYDLGPSGR
jgi:translation initiation factor 2-alpha kinase 4